jgi:ATP-binding cassette subfamily F protein 3
MFFLLVATNHLDLEAVLWLEAHLQQYPHTVIAVSHDRGFLNEVCTDTIEFKDKKLTYYRGNFDTYVKLKNEKMKNAMREYQAYLSKREHMMEFITKFRANAKRATMVRTRFWVKFGLLVLIVAHCLMPFDVG